MTDLIAELAEVVRLSADDDHDSMIGAGYAVRFLRTHHAEIEAMARDAARYRWLRDSQRLCDGTETGGIYIGIESDVFWGIAGEKADETIDAAMRDSAREDGNE